MKVTRISDRVELTAEFLERGITIGYDQNKNRFRAWTIYFECGHDSAAYFQMDTRVLAGLSPDEIVGFMYSSYRQFLAGIAPFGFEASWSELPRPAVPELSTLSAKRSETGEPVSVGWHDLGDVIPGYDSDEMPFAAFTDYFEIDGKAIVCVSHKSPQPFGGTRTSDRISCLASHGLRVTAEAFG